MHCTANISIAGLRIKDSLKHLLSRVILSTSGERLVKYFCLEILHKTDLAIKGYNSSCLIDENRLCSWIWQCGLEVVNLSSVTPQLCVNQPPALPHWVFQLLLLLHTHGCHISFLTRKRSKQPRLKLFICPQATLQICQQMPEHQGSFGSLIPLRFLFCKTKAHVFLTIDLEACLCCVKLDMWNLPGHTAAWKLEKWLLTSFLCVFWNKAAAILKLF